MFPKPQANVVVQVGISISNKKIVHLELLNQNEVDHVDELYSTKIN
jgi:hypothetical protein